MKCPICGTEAAPGNLFCEICGQPLPAASTPPELSKKNNKKSIIIIAAAAVVLVAAIAVVTVILLGNKKTPTVGEITTDNTPSESITISSNFEVTLPSTTLPETTQETTTSKKTVPTFTYNDTPQQNNADQYLFDSANKKITFDYLNGCTRDEVTIIINEIYARHGYIFKDAELREYFNSQSWYSGTTASMEEAASRFNATERANVDTIYAYQKQMGWR